MNTLHDSIAFHLMSRLSEYTYFIKRILSSNIYDVRLALLPRYETCSLFLKWLFSRNIRGSFKFTVSTSHQALDI